jgi:PKD repeat protein
MIITLKGINTNSNGIGARVELYGVWGKQIRDVRSGIGFRHMGTLNTHFGIGTATTIDSVVVRWPSGNVDVICNPYINTILHIEENSGPTPLTEFQVSNNNLLEMDTVTFNDNSTVCPNFWIWTIDPSSGWSFVNGSNANSQNPEMVFEQPGSYFVTLWSGNSNGMSNNLQTDTITVNSLVGMNTILSKQLRVFPNPARDFLQLNNLPPSIASVKITNMLGEHVEAIYSSDSQVLSIASLSPGVYLATVVLHSGEIMQSRFVKE